MSEDTIRYGRRRSSTTVTATDAAKNFGELVDRVREAGVAIVVERKGRPIARISPMATHTCTLGDLAGWFETRRALPDDYATAVKAHVKTANRPRVPSVRWQP